MVLFSCSALTDQSHETPFTGNPLSPLVPIPIDPPPDSNSNKPSETQYCFADENGHFSEEARVTQGDAGNYVWAEGGSCIFRPIRTAWAATHNQPVMVWSGVDQSSYRLLGDPPSGVSHLYEVDYFVDEIIDVLWTMNWYHSVRAGSRQKPQQILMNYVKVKGTRFISYWEGTILLHEVTPDITAITMRDQIKASRTGPGDSADAIRQIIEAIRTGAPNWAPID